MHELEFVKTFGMRDICRLFGKSKSSIKYRVSRGLLPYHRDDRGRKRFCAGDLVAYVERIGIPEELLDQDTWNEVVNRASASGADSRVEYPITLIINLEGGISGSTEGAWFFLGYQRAELIGGKHLDLKLDIKDADLGVPIPFRELDRATYEPLRIKWESFNKEECKGLAWITPLRTGEDQIGGWSITFDAPGSPDDS